MSNLFYHVDEFWKSSLPVISCVFFLLLMVVPWPFRVITLICSTFPLIVLCFWVMNRPDYFAAPWSFAIGFMQDVVLGQPLGVMALSYLAVDFFLRGQRHFFQQQSFLRLWLVFVCVMVGVAMAQWLVVSRMVHAWVDVRPMLLYAAFGIVLFPVMTMLLHHIQHNVYARE